MAGSVDFALAPSESVIAHRFAAKPTKLKAIAAVLEQDASAVAVRADSGITRPRHLDGRVYASYGARFEEGIVREMIRADRGRGNTRMLRPGKLGIWDTILDGTADATWMFENWEGIDARLMGVELRCFRMEDYGIPYGYSPLLLVSEAKLDAVYGEVVRAFLMATKKGFRMATERPEEAAKILQEYVPAGTSPELVLASQRWLAERRTYGVPTDWGRMSFKKWEDWISWLRAQGLLKHRNGSEIEGFEVTDLFTNDFLT